MGTFEPNIVVDARKPEADCSFQAEGKPSKAAGSSMELSPGQYRMLVTCLHRGVTLKLPLPKVKIRAGRASKPKIVVRPVGIRVESRRNNILLPASVQLFEVGQKEPLAEIPANQRKVVAEGRYDVLVTLEDPNSPKAQTFLPKVKLRKGKTNVLKADLSDGTLLVSAWVNNKKSSGSVRVFRPGSTKDVGLVETDQELRLPAGHYQVATELRETADFATRKQMVWIRAKRIQKIKERFDIGLLSVSVVKDKKPVEATVKLSVQGAVDFFNYFSSPGTVSLSPGNYDITVASDAAGPLKKLQMKNVSIKKRGHTKKVFDLTPASLSIKVLKNWEPAEAKLIVRHAGGGKTVEPGLGGGYRLWPGRYEILATLKNGDEQLDGPFEVELGKAVKREINFKRAVLTVRAMRGQTLEPNAEVFVFKRGAGKPTSKGRSGARIEVQPGVYDIKVVAGENTIWRQKIKIKRVQNVDVELPAEAEAPPLPEGDLPPPETALPEGDPG